MREYLFRGKRVNNGEWVYGYYMKQDNKHIIVDTTKGSLGFGVQVYNETVGEYVGLKDKNGKKIFEGDIVHCWGGEYAFGLWEHNNTFAFTDISDYMQMVELGENEFLEIIGNIHDNKELLGE